MSITVTSVTVDGRAYPWGFQGSTAAGPANAYVAYGHGYNDGSSTSSHPVANASYRYGQQHGNAGETGPAVVSVNPYQYIVVKYSSGTVATNATGATACTPAGATGTTLVPIPVDGTDSSGYSLPTNVISPLPIWGITGANGFNPSGGTCSTSSTQATYISGSSFDSKMQGGTLWLYNPTGATAAAFRIVAVGPTAGTLTTATTMGTQSGVGFFYSSARTNIGGLVGAFLDVTGAVVSTWDWAGCGGTSATGSYIGIVAPAGASTLSMGVNDTILSDNSGSFILSVMQMDSDFLSMTGSDNTSGYGGSEDFWTQYPVGQCCPGAMRDHATVSTGSTSSHPKQTVFGSTYFLPQTTAGLSLIATYVGQLFPRGAQNWGGNPAGTFGQNFPY